MKKSTLQKIITGKRKFSRKYKDKLNDDKKYYKKYMKNLYKIYNEIKNNKKNFGKIENCDNLNALNNDFHAEKDIKKNIRELGIKKNKTMANLNDFMTRICKKSTDILKKEETDAIFDSVFKKRSCLDNLDNLKNEFYRKYSTAIENYINNSIENADNKNSTDDKLPKEDCSTDLYGFL